jgi:diacylglycerol kinase family enzyme
MAADQTVLIAYNPKAGASDRQALLERLSARLRDLGLLPCLVADLAELQLRAAELDRRGKLRLVVAGGGDGTVAAVAERVSPDTTIAVFPLGTENLLAKWLGSTNDIEPFCRAVDRCETIAIDALSANGRLALITIGVGFDAEVVRQVHCNRRGHITKWSYAWPIWRTFWNYAFPTMQLTITNEAGGVATKSRAETPFMEVAEPAEPEGPRTQKWRVPWVFVANLPSYAGGLSIVPLADPQDGRLDIATFSGHGRLRGLAYVFWIALRRHIYCRDFRSITADRLRIESDREVSYQIDGDFGGVLPLEIHVLPARVRLLRFDGKADGP